jgi:hypothetical protein
LRLQSTAELRELNGNLEVLMSKHSLHACPKSAYRLFGHHLLLARVGRRICEVGDHLQCVPKAESMRTSEHAELFRQSDSLKIGKDFVDLGVSANVGTIEHLGDEIKPEPR